MGHSKPKQLIFEEYLSFFCNRHSDSLTIEQLNQILFFHGFQQLKYGRKIRMTKEEIIVAVSSLNLIPPSRFGLIDGHIQVSISSPLSALSLEVVKHDIREIGWEECPVGSILTINPAALAVADNSNSTPTSQKKRRGKASRMNINAERSGLQPPLAVESAKKDVKAWSNNRISWEKTTMQVPAKNSSNADPYTWHANGNTKILGHPYSRWYYKCSEIGCFARKHVDRDANDPSMCIITYKGQHNHTIS